MIRACMRTLCDLAASDERIWLLVGDVGWGWTDEFARLYPDRFVNCGIAEQNMIGVAAGLALSGKQPWVYSISTFPTIRCLEQIRNDILDHNLDVKIICKEGPPKLGISHQIRDNEDVRALRAVGEIDIWYPTLPGDCEKAVADMHSRKTPCYMRIPR